MKTNFVRAAFVAALMSTAAIAAITPASAADKVSSAVAKPLSEASKALAAKDYKGALAATQQAQAVPDQTPFDTYKINSFLMAIEIGLQDQAAATKPAEDAADLPAMPEEDKKDMLHNALVLSYNAKDYAKSVSYGQKLEQAGGIDDSIQAMMAVSYYNLKDTANAKIYAQKSIDAAKAAGKQPNEAAMQIVMSSQAATDQGAAEGTLEQIVLSYNRPDDWDQLVNVSLLKGMTNADALNLFRLLFIQGPMKTGDDYTTMGSLADAQRDYVEEAKVLEGGVTAGKVSGGAELSKARGQSASDQKIIEQALSAAQKSKKGEDSMQIAQDLWGYGRFADVESIATAAKAKGGIKDPGEATVLIGMAQIAQGKYDAGIATLGQVTGGAPRMRVAHLWTLYAQAKQKAGGAAAPAQ